MSILPASFEPSLGLLGREPGKSSRPFSLVGFDWQAPPSSFSIKALATPSRRPRPIHRPRRIRRNRPLGLGRKYRPASPALTIPIRPFGDADQPAEPIEPASLRDAVILEAIAFEMWQSGLDDITPNVYAMTAEEFAPYKAQGDAFMARIVAGMADYGEVTGQGRTDVDLVHECRFLQLTGGKNVDFYGFHPGATIDA